MNAVLPLQKKKTGRRPSALSKCPNLFDVPYLCDIMRNHDAKSFPCIAPTSTFWAQEKASRVPKRPFYQNRGLGGGEIHLPKGKRLTSV